MQSIFSEQQLSTGYYDNNCFNTGWIMLCFLHVRVGGRVFRTLKKGGVLSLANAGVYGGSENTRIMYNSAVQHSLLGLNADDLKERSNN